MTQLLTLYAADRPWADVALYCWSHNEVHQFSLSDVERIVYALGALEQHAYQLAAEDPDLGGDLGRVGPSCLKDVLQVAGDPECAAEHVEQGVECREAAPDAEPGPPRYVNRRCCGTPVGGEHLGWCVLPVEEAGPAGKWLDAERRGETL